MPTSKKWFFLINNEVQGPHLATEIQNLIQKNSAGLVWGQGLSDWLKPEDWQKTISDLNNILASLQGDLVPQWRVKQGDFEAGPFIYDHLIQVLKSHPNPGDVMIFHEPEKAWKNIYDFPIIVEEVGISRRAHERVPISGLFRYEKDGAECDSLLLSISEGGFGIIEAKGLSVGERIRGVIQSPQLPIPITCNCEAVYRQADNSWGMRFLNLPLESQSLVISYTQKLTK